MLLDGPFIHAMLLANSRNVDSQIVPGHHEFERTPYSIVIHHTAAHSDHINPRPSLHTVINGRPDLAGPLCNFLIGYDGSCTTITKGVAWHAGREEGPAPTARPGYGNGRSIGIEVDSDGTQKWSPEQYRAVLTLTRILCIRYGIPARRVKGHREICLPRGRKIDPRPTKMNLFRARLLVAKLRSAR